MLLAALEERLEAAGGAGRLPTVLERPGKATSGAEGCGREGPAIVLVPEMWREMPERRKKEGRCQRRAGVTVRVCPCVLVPCRK